MNLRCRVGLLDLVIFRPHLALAVFSQLSMFLLEDSLPVRHLLRPFLKLFLLEAGASIALILSLAQPVNAQTQILSSGPAGQVVKTPQVQATLLALAPNGLGPGKTLWLGLELVHQAHWHTYWRNPGDSGLPTELQWKLPTGMVAGPLVWPAPRRIPIGSLANYGYEDTTLLVTPIQMGPSFKPQNNESSIQIDLRANWLVCKQECIPQEGDFSIKLPIQGATAMARDAFDKALQLQAQALPGQHQARIASDGRTLQLSLSQLPQCVLCVGQARLGLAVEVLCQTHRAPWQLRPEWAA